MFRVVRPVSYLPGAGYFWKYLVPKKLFPLLLLPRPPVPKTGNGIVSLVWSKPRHSLSLQVRVLPAAPLPRGRAGGHCARPALAGNGVWRSQGCPPISAAARLESCPRPFLASSFGSRHRSQASHARQDSPRGLGPRFFSGRPHSERPLHARCRACRDPLRHQIVRRGRVRRPSPRHRSVDTIAAPAEPGLPHQRGTTSLHAAGARRTTTSRHVHAGHRHGRL